MSPTSSSRGTAEELQRVLDGAGTAEESARQARLVRTVGLLTEHPAVQPRAGFSSDLRARLMAAAETELVPDRTAVVRTLRPVTPARRRVGAVAASLVIVGSTAGLAAASGDALPGETLYPVKRGTEQVGTTLAVGEARKGRSVLDQAATRLQEAQELQDEGADDRLVTGALRSFRASAADGSSRLFAAYEAEQDQADVVAVRSFAAAQMKALDTLSQDAEPVVAAALVDAADTLADLDLRAQDLCPGCQGEELVMPTSVAAGAGRATVDALLARPVAQAGLDRRAMEDLRLGELRDLRDAAQRSAGDVGASEELQREVPPVEVDQHGPVASTITPRTETPKVLSDRPVRDLLEGVTGTVTGVTGTLRTTVPEVGPALDGVEKVTEDLDDTVTGVTGGLLP
ncbi:DUF5667 domain-containing protein [Nocardioides aurantiacus]|uniref:DUF5667 domain-containing protein n=1 Tax=Nocardioides aurantiacus TaxID=86796 RepID=A0A3N2CQ94_9ACTN|nr:DUF5667 domain-containing protein [Nocardioides aurantiacus]ROR89484.1 hypothetical protein EDD33_0309 [Nocardioides aurantiacus]